MALMSVLIKIARRVVEQVQSDLMKQIQRVESEAKQPIRAMVEQVVGGMWIGKGADAFVEEVSSILVPGINVGQQQMETMNTNIGTALDIMDQADSQVNQLVNGLADMFGGVF
jgi:uncharacterized protein YukE